LLDTSAERAEVLDLEGRLLAINARGRSALEAARVEPSNGCEWIALWSESSRAAAQAALAQAKRGHTARFEAASPARDFTWRVTLSPLRGADGQPARLLAIARELSDRTLESPPVSEDLLRLAIRGANLATWQWDLRTGALAWSERAFAMFGISPRPRFGYHEFRSLVDPRDHAMIDAHLERAIRDHVDLDVELRVIWPDQSRHWVRTRARAVYDAQGTPLRMEGVAHDITPRRTAERQLRGREQRYRQLADAVPNLVWAVDLSGRVTYVNGRWLEYTQRPTIAPHEWSSVLHPDDLPRARAIWHEFPMREASLEALRLRRHDGVYLWFACRWVAVRDDDGEIAEIIGTGTEIEQLKQVEDALRESRTRLDTALRYAGMGTWVWNMDKDIVELDDALCQLLGFSNADSVRVAAMWMQGVHADDAPIVQAAVTGALEHGADIDVDCRMRRADGVYLWIAVKGRVQTPTSHGDRMMYGASVDLTQHKRLEEELRQAQKMEAIGQLAGGVAHDFNNLMMVIMGQASLISDTPGLPIAVHGSAREIVEASERAASLTAQLLAFGRRQTMQKIDLDLNEVVASVGQMLQRLLGEAVVLAIEPWPSVLALRADPNMLVQVLLNLAVNARDAMPAGGELTIRATRKLADERSASGWACLTVRDTGDGIPPDVMPRIFEPFFTTKDAGKGTGLGLSTVYGIVEQHHGFIAVDSAPGRGATFTVHLPLPAQEISAATSAATAQAAHGKNELVLLVEDDAGVRAAMSSILQQHEYRLLVADDGVQALELFAARGGEIDLLLSDVVLPRGLSGADLAQQLRQQNPRLQVILSSGYGADKIDQALAQLPGVLVLQKPFRVELLLAALRSLLDQPRAPAQAARAGM
jgi:PAS domain S-box-containing protein